eukprot:c52248_g1_i1.p1 GENE.c52248_g1_i1~~c52248_g1_i1.p1  ORF type:complete len:496 (+),score=161.94 c52248_g1_i1:70-1488(+)
MAEAATPTPPAPNATGASTRLEKPNQAELDKKVKDLDDKIKANRAIVADVRSKLDNLTKQKESGGDRMSVEAKALKELRDQSKVLVDERNALFERLKEGKAALGKLRDQQDEMKKRLKENDCFSTEAVEKKIRELEYHLATHSLNLKEEKMVIQDIKNLNASKKIISEYDSMGARKTDLEDKIKQISTKLDENKKALDAAKIKEKAQSALVTDIKKPNPKLEIKGLIEARNAANAENQQLNEQIKALKNEFREKEFEFKKAMKAKYDEQKQRKQADYEKRKEEDRIRRLEEEEEKIDRLHVDAFATIEQLKLYLQKVQKAQADDEVKEEVAAFTPAEGQIGKLVTGFDEDIYGTRKAAKKPKAKKAKKVRRLVHDLVCLKEFETLKIEAPLDSEGIPAALEALEKKKAELEADKKSKQANRLTKLAAAKEGGEDKKDEAAAAESKEEETKTTTHADAHEAKPETQTTSEAAA